MLVLRGGRVVDPANGVDAVRDVVVADGSIVARAAPGATVLDVSGLVVGPGFVDVHSHAQDLAGQRLQALDGVTTALELEGGLAPLELAYERCAREGRTLNYGFSASWAAARARTLLGTQLDATFEQVVGVLGEPGWQVSSTARQRREWLGALADDLDAGALGVGVLLGYAPSTDPAEFEAVARLAAGSGGPVFTHIRELVADDPATPVDGALELVQVARETGARLHHCHVNSTGRRNLPHVLETLRVARAEGLALTAEAYPYGAGATAVGAAFLAPERLVRWGLVPTDLTMIATGERVADARRLHELRTTTPGAHCAVAFLDEAVPADRDLLERPFGVDGLLVASDAMPVGLPAATAPDAWPLPHGAVTHPRTAGTFSRALRRMVRERGDWSWSEAFRRCSSGPAALLTAVASDARAKGHLGAGADADVVVLDPHVLTDRATFADPVRPSVGVRHLLVAGESVVRDGALVPDARPGRPLRGRVG